MNKEFKVGDLVKLSPQAVQDFYGNEKRLEMFDRAGDPKWLNEDFVQFVNQYLGFESGEMAGYVVGLNGDYPKVKFFGPLGWMHSFYERNDLIKIEV